MADDTIEAGRYELVAEVWDEPISKLGEPYNFVHHVKGDLVDLNVEEARRLVRAGAVIEPGSRERAAALAAKAQYEAALAALPESVRAELAADQEAAANDAAAAALEAAASGTRPAQAAPKATWEAYRVSQLVALGVDDADARAQVAAVEGGKQGLVRMEDPTEESVTQPGAGGIGDPAAAGGSGDGATPPAS